MRKLLLGLIGLLFAVPAVATDSGAISSVTVAGLVAQNGTPTPNAPVDIVSNNGVLKVSRNLYNPNATQTGWIATNNTISGAGKYIRISAQPGDNYTFSATWDSADGNNLLAISARDSSDNGLQRWVTRGNVTSATLSVTAPVNTAYLVFASYTTTPETIQLELGSTATPYVPYGEIYTDGEVETIADSANHAAKVATLLGVGDNRDTQNINTGAITRKVGVKVLDGTEEWVASEAYSNLFYSSAAITNADTSNNYKPISTHFNGVLGNTGYAAMQAGDFKHGSGSSIFYFKMPDITTAAQFEQYLAEQYSAGTPVIVVYPLATSTTESVAGQTMTTAPVNNRTGGVTGMTITTLLSSGASVVTTIAADAIKIATTAYNSARFTPVVTELNDTIATIRDVVTNTINQTKAIADLQATKQTRPDETCPAGKKCLLVEDNDGQPHWYEIIESANRLPDGFTELEYVEATSSGPGFKDNLVIKNTQRIEIDLNISGNESGQAWIAGHGASTWPEQTTMRYNSGTKLVLQAGGSSATELNSPNTRNARTLYTLDILNKKSYVNGVQVLDFTGYAFSPARTDTWGYMCYSTGADNTLTGCSKGKLYSIKVYDNNVLVRNFIPAKRNSDNVVGMYDLVSGQFLTNQGTGTFVAGPEI